MKKIGNILTAVVIGFVCAPNVWAVAKVGDQLTLSNLDTSFEAVDVAGNVVIGSLLIPATEDLPLGSKVTVQSIGLGYRNNYRNYLVLATESNADRANTGKTTSTKTLTKTDGTTVEVNWVTYTYNDVEMTVGTPCPANGRDGASGSATGQSSDLRLVKPISAQGLLKTAGSYPAYSLAYEIAYTVSQVAEPYTYTVGSGWNREIPTEFGADDQVVFKGTGSVVLDRNIPGTLSIYSGTDLILDEIVPTGSVVVNSGATLTLKKGPICRSKVTNNGTIKVIGGTLDAPLVITEDAGADTTIGTVEIAANSCLKIDATGAGNKKYTVTGAGADSSTLILASNHDWGLTDGSVVREVKTIVTHKCWWERTNAFDATVDLVMQGVEMVTCNNAYTIGSISGTGSFSKSGNASITVSQPNGDAELTGACAVPLTVNGTNTLTLKGTPPPSLTVAETATVILNPTADAVNLPTMNQASANRVTLASGTFNFAGNRVTPAVMAEGVSIKLTATNEEIVAGEIALPATSDSATIAQDVLSVFDNQGNAVTIAAVEQTEEKVTIRLSTNEGISETCSLSEKISDTTTGSVIVTGATGEDPAIVVTVDCAIPASANLVASGKVTFAFADGLAPSAGTIILENGAVATVSGTVANTISVQSGATLKTSGDVTLLASKQIQTPGQKNSIVEIPAGSKLTLTANNQIGANVKVKIYGTLDLATFTLSYNNNPGQCEYNFYAGSVMTGTGAFKMTGGYTAEYYVRAYADATVPYATISVPRARDAYDCAINVNVDAGVGLKWLSSAPAGHQADITIKGTDVRGLEIQNVTNLKFGNYEKGLKGDLVIGTGAKLTLTRTDSLEYNSANGAAIINLDIAGTLDCGAFRQTLSNSGNGHVAGKMVLREGGQIIGAGADWKSTKCALDVWKPETIEVKGMTTISASIYLEAESSTITVKPLEENGSGTLVLTTLNGNANATIDLQPGAQVQLPAAIAESKVITTARGKMIAVKETAEGQKIYRTVNKSFTISVQ